MPLTEDCGIIEWVPRTSGLRQCCESAYMAEGLYDRRLTNPSIKKLYDAHPVRRLACHCLAMPHRPLASMSDVS